MNVDNQFSGTIINSISIRLRSKELVDRWKTEHLEDPVED
jgi:hypothetical protein